MPTSHLRLFDIPSVFLLGWFIGQARRGKISETLFASLVSCAARGTHRNNPPGRIRNLRRASRAVSVLPAPSAAGLPSGHRSPTSRSSSATTGSAPIQKGRSIAVMVPRMWLTKELECVNGINANSKTACWFRSVTPKNVPWPTAPLPRIVSRVADMVRRSSGGQRLSRSSPRNSRPKY